MSIVCSKEFLVENTHGCMHVPGDLDVGIHQEEVSDAIAHLILRLEQCVPNIDSFVSLTCSSTETILIVHVYYEDIVHWSCRNCKNCRIYFSSYSPS